MLLTGIPQVEIAQTLGSSRAGLKSHAAAMLRKLEALPGEVVDLDGGRATSPRGRFVSGAGPEGVWALLSWKRDIRVTGTANGSAEALTLAKRRRPHACLISATLGQGRDIDPGLQDEAPHRPASRADLR